MKRITKGPGDSPAPEPTTGCDGCGLDGCPECARFEPCSRGHRREDGEPCGVWIECECGVDTCNSVPPGKTCSDCGKTYQDEHIGFIHKCRGVTVKMIPGEHCPNCGKSPTEVFPEDVSQ